MNPRLAVVLLIAFVAVLIFVGYLLERKRAVRRREMAVMRERMIAYEQLLDDIARMAARGVGLDVTAEQIRMLLQRHAEKEIK